MMARDALIQALLDAEGLPVPTVEEMAERLEQSLSRHGFEVRTKHSSEADFAHRGHATCEVHGDHPHGTSQGLTYCGFCSMCSADH